MARKTTQAAMFFEVCKHNFDRLPAQPVDRFGFFCFHPGLMRDDDVFVWSRTRWLRIMVRDPS
jgi:hypothetical protein